ncbi:MAG: IS66 family transposase [Symploca sp. SIO3C6]|nr:IS66 family transposase [Symploca sp. SIO3C6]
MSKPDPLPSLSESDIRAIYAQGEDAVVSVVMQLLSQLNRLESRVNEIEGRLSKNSRNSSKPPSSDGFKQRTKSLRQKSEKPSGGQKGHQGQTLEWREHPDEVEVHPVHECSECGASLGEVPLEQVLSRQVFDIPPIALQVKEHEVEVKCCPHCGVSNQGSFPSEATNVVQYGPHLKGMMVYLMEGQLLPSHRVCELLADMMNVELSEGTLYTTKEQCFNLLEPFEKTLHQAVLDSDVVHFDETGFRVNQQLWWLHVACTNGLVYYQVHPKRGRSAMDEIDILPEFEGKAIHDGLKSYQGYECEHFLCNAHHLRELQYMVEHYGQGWAFQLSLLLVSIHSHVKRTKAEGGGQLSTQELEAFDARYEAILNEGFSQNPIPPPDPNGPKKRGRSKRSPPRNLLERLRQQKSSVLGFMYDFTIPFDNNQSERDLRMMKLKQKISGCFRSEDGAKRFCRIRGYLATLRKQGRNIMDSLVDLFSGIPQSPLPQPE